MITAIGRYFQINPNIVGVITTDNLATITANGYLTTQEDEIFALNSGDFEWQDTDIILISYSGGIGFFTRDTVNDTFDALPASPGTLSDTLQDGEIFVGSALNIATGVPMSGDATISNAGALTIANDAITTAKILNANVTLAKLASGIAPSHVIKFANQETTVGGAAAEAFTVTGAVAATDIAFVQVVDNGTNNVTVLQAVVTNDTLTVTFSADPGNDTVINYQIIRAAS